MYSCTFPEYKCTCHLYSGKALYGGDKDSSNYNPNSILNVFIQVSSKLCDETKAFGSQIKALKMPYSVISHKLSKKLLCFGVSAGVWPTSVYFHRPVETLMGLDNRTVYPLVTQPSRLILARWHNALDSCVIRLQVSDLLVLCYKLNPFPSVLQSVQSF